MPRSPNRNVKIWILVFVSFAIVLAIYGGFVRLTRSGLSIVEWSPVNGALLPGSPAVWKTEFSKYQRTPEFKQINFNMTLAQYQEIFIIEWLHRILARLAGIVFLLPLVVFALNRSIPIREIGLYLLMGALFLSQAILGWTMVASGLVDQPAVSQYLLTGHLFLALTLIGISVWTALGHHYGFPASDAPAKWSGGSLAALAVVFVVLAQMAFGGLAAGLKAGHVSDTWPLMLGHLVPPGLLGQLKPGLLNLVAAPLTVAFIHRWLAFVMLIAAIILYVFLGNWNSRSDVRRAAGLLLALGVLQIVLGITVVVSHVQIGIALAHQANAIVLFATTIYLLHRLRAADRELSA